MTVRAKLLRVDQYERGYDVQENEHTVYVMFKDEVVVVLWATSPHTTVDALRKAADDHYNRMMSGVNFNGGPPYASSEAANGYEGGH